MACDGSAAQSIRPNKNSFRFFIVFQINGLTIRRGSYRTARGSCFDRRANTTRVVASAPVIVKEKPSHALPRDKVNEMIPPEAPSMVPAPFRLAVRVLFVSAAPEKYWKK